MNRDRIRLNSDQGGEAGGGSGPSIHEQAEVLISRLADGEGAPSDWESFSTLAQRIPDAWEQLAKAQRDHAALSVAVGVALHAADRVELPSKAAAEAFAGSSAEHVEPERIVFWSRVRAWGGWAAAATVALAWSAGGFKGLPLRSGSTPNQASMIPAGYLKIDTPDDAVNAYLDIGKKAQSVVGEVPQRVIIDQRPTPDGKGYETTYLRQFIEKTVVREFYESGAKDEAGRADPMPVTPKTTPEAPQ